MKNVMKQSRVNETAQAGVTDAILRRRRWCDEQGLRWWEEGV